MPSGQGPTAARAKALAGAGGIAWWSDREASRALYGEALAIERGLGDPARLAEALYNQAFVVAAEQDVEAAARLLDESLELFRQLGDEAGVARAQVMLVVRDAMAGAWDLVVARIEEVDGDLAPARRPPQPRLRPDLAGVRPRARRTPGRRPGHRPRGP